jgi:hypothetical protein
VTAHTVYNERRMATGLIVVQEGVRSENSIDDLRVALSVPVW